MIASINLLSTSSSQHYAYIVPSFVVNAVHLIGIVLLDKAPKLKELIEELTEITEWYQLGVLLGLQTYILDEVKQQFCHDGPVMMKIKMLDRWLKVTPPDLPSSPSWENLVKALKSMGQKRVAKRIADKHCRLESGESRHDLE